MKSVQKGFTLIELMIVVAIIGILAAIAIPAYQDYTIRSQVTEGLNLAGAVKVSVAEYYAQEGEWPTTLAAAGIDNVPAGKYVQSVDVTDGTIAITYGVSVNEKINGGVLTLQPWLSANDDVIWVCGNASEPSTATGDGGSASGSTDIVDKYLPASCRTLFGS
jgi:type IV pilus assembly protein PilA